MEGSNFIPHECREWRRLRALHLMQRGWYQRDIAEALDVSEEGHERMVNGWAAASGEKRIDFVCRNRLFR